jgi:prepilin-type N-terminal cleavage/methylation domain-containing protein
MDTAMYFRLMGKLNARRQAILKGEETEKGFTLIELLVVVIIIGILAAIAIPIYIGVQNNAKDSAVKSDVTNAKTAVVAYETDKGTYPSTVDTTTLATYGYASTSDYSATGAAAPAYSPSAPASVTAGFCIKATSPTGNIFWATSSSGVTQSATAPSGC